MACSPVCGPSEIPSRCRELECRHALPLSRVIGTRAETAFPHQRKKPAPELPSLKATPHSSASQGQNVTLVNLLDNPNFRAKFVSDAVVHNDNSNTKEAEAGQF